MMLGKRARPPMKRTTSMTELTLDLNGSAQATYQPLDPHNPFNGADQRGFASVGAATATPRLHRRNSADFSQTAPFLKVCTLCKRRLIPGRDIYMYRGDSAFCSLECRQQQMTQDERKEKCSSMASKMDAPTAAVGSQVSGTVETVSAV